MGRSDGFEKGATRTSRDVDIGYQKREVAKELSLQELHAEDGLAKRPTKLKDTFDKEAVDVSFQDYVKFESIRRSDDVDMSTYNLELDRAHARLGKHSMTVPDSVLACKLLYSSIIDAKERTMVLATTQKLEYKIMKSSLKRISKDTVSAPSCSTGPLKEEPVFVASDESAKSEETAFCVNKWRNKMWRYRLVNSTNAGRNPVGARER